jgi:hypothetical protein
LVEQLLHLRVAFLLPTFFDLWSQVSDILVDRSLPSDGSLAHVMPCRGFRQRHSLGFVTHLERLNQFVRVRYYIGGVIDKR